MVRDELGPDAVILSNRRTDEGVVVFAAMDYDEAAPGSTEAAPLAMAATTPGPARPAAAPSFCEPELTADEDSESVLPGEEPPPPTAVSMDLVRREVSGLRELLECQLSSLAWNELSRSNPMRVSVLHKLSAMGLDAQLAREIADGLPRVTDPEEAERHAAHAIVKRLPVLKDDLLEAGGVVAVVGATGVGKTTTVAKLAARYVMRHGPDEVCLLSTDTYRIGARDQLLSYARILGVPLFVAKDRQELAAILGAQSSRRLVLIDTAGMSQRDARLAEQFALLQSQGARTRVLLALSAASDLHTLDELVATFAQASPAACVLTKLDETASLGAAISVLVRHGIPLAWCSNGQRVPEDLHPAHNKRMWMVLTAMRLARNRRPATDERVLARSFTEVHAHA